jgi:flagellar basal body-associated protein FliL
MVTALKKLLLLSLLFTFLSCSGDPFKEEKELEDDMINLEKNIDQLNKKNITSEEIINHLWEVEEILTWLQDGRNRMADELDRLTKESYELHARKIDLLREGRFELYNHIDDFLVCSYQLTDLIKSQVYYHERQELNEILGRVQRKATAMVQDDPPLSNATYSYYKNLDKITSQTADEDGSWYYTIEVSIGYNLNEKDTQTLINSSKLALGGLVRSYFSGLTKDQIIGTPEPELKAGLVIALNNHLIKFADFKNNKMEGIKLITMNEVQTYEFH